MKRFLLTAAVLGCALLHSSCTDVVVLSGKPIEVTIWAYWNCPHPDRCTQTLEWQKPDGTIATRTIYWAAQYTLGAYDLGSDVPIRIIPNSNSCPVSIMYVKQSEGHPIKSAYDYNELTAGTSHHICYDE